MIAAIVAIWSPYLVHWKLGLNSDSSVPVLMARKILDGERPLYFWGQWYLGAVDSYCAAALMALFGRDATFVAYLPTLLAYAFGAALLVHAAPAAERGPRAFLLLFAPPGAFIAIARCGISQDALLWLGFAALIALRPALERDPLAPRALPRAALAGVVLAITAYRIPSAMIAVPVLFALAALAALADHRARPEQLAARIRARALQLVTVLVIAQLQRLPELTTGPPPELHMGFDLAGAPRRLLPLLGTFLQLDPIGRFGVSTYGHYTYYSGLPIGVVGERWQSVLAQSPFSWTVALGAVALCAVGFARIVRDALRAVRAARMPEVHGLYFALLLPALLAGIVTQTMFFDAGSARYLLAAFFPIVTCAAAALALLPRRLRLVLAGAWALLVVAGHARMLPHDDAAIAELERGNAFLLARGVTAGRADYWLAYVNVLLSHERLVLAPSQSDRYPQYPRHVSHQRTLALLELCPFEGLSEHPPLSEAEYRTLERRAFGNVCITVLERRAP